jgi:glyoxylase I family protein
MMEQRESPTGTTTAASTPRVSHDLRLDFHGVRYQVKDVARSVTFYTQELGFKLEHQHLPEFATVSLGALKIFLSGPGASGSRPMPGGQRQEPGGWNRIVLHVADLAACIEALKKDRLHFRNEMEVGPAGKQIQIEDPDGNPVELFEPARSQA